MIKMMQKKGDVPDVLILMVTIFILAIGLFTISFAIVGIVDGFREVDMNSTSEAESMLVVMDDLATQTIPKGFFFLFVGLSIGTLVSAFFTKQHPIFMALYIFFLILTVFIGIYLANAYDDVTNLATFAGFADTQGMINVVMRNIIKIVIGVGILSMIIIFGKFSERRGERF